MFEESWTVFLSIVMLLKQLETCKCKDLSGDIELACSIRPISKREKGESKQQGYQTNLSLDRPRSLTMKGA